jgi:acyl carrier protein
MTTTADIRSLILSFLQPSLLANGIDTGPMPDDTDLRAAGLIDSLGFVQLLSELEHRLGITVDLSDMDPAQLTNLGALSRHIAARASAA